MKCLLIFSLFVPAYTHAQQDSAITYTEIVQVESLTGDQLFDAARVWMPFETIDFRIDSVTTDKAHGHLAGKGFCVGILDKKDTKMLLNSKASFVFSIDIWITDGKYKYLVSGIRDDFSYLLTSSPVSPVKYPLSSQKASDRFWLANKKAFDRQIQVQIASLKTHMSRARDFLNRLLCIWQYGSRGRFHLILHASGRGTA